MTEIDTLDDLIRRLETLKETLGGSTPVRLQSHGRHLSRVETGTVRLAKNDPFKEVSRGGHAAVVLL